jgi:hypothetical protein
MFDGWSIELWLQHACVLSWDRLDIAGKLLQAQTSRSTASSKPPPSSVRCPTGYTKQCASCTASQQIPYLCWNMKFYYPVHYSTSRRVLKQLESVHTGKHIVFKIHFNNIQATVPRFLNQSSSLKFYIKFLYKCFHLFHHLYKLNCPFYPS